MTVRSSAALPGEKTGSSVNTTATSSARSSNNPYRSGSGYPTPPGSASPRNARFPDLVDRQSPQTTGVSTQIPTSTGGTKSSINHASPMPHFQGQRRRTSSLTQRHPGDQTHRPLDMLKREDHRANRSPHLRKKTHVGADSIDTLDNVGPTSAYHHEGPYDATLLARNMDPKHAPIAAVREGNAKALEATPRELVNDSVRRHRPLDGVAVVPPGMVGPNGEVMRYEEGSDMMIEGRPEGGEFRRWPGIVSPLSLLSLSFLLLKVLSPHPPLLTNNAYPNPVICNTNCATTHHPTNRNTSPTTSKAKANPPSPSKKPSRRTPTSSKTKTKTNNNNPTSLLPPTTTTTLHAPTAATPPNRKPQPTASPPAPSK